MNKLRQIDGLEVRILVEWLDDIKGRRNGEVDNHLVFLSDFLGAQKSRDFMDIFVCVDIDNFIIFFGTGLSFHIDRIVAHFFEGRFPVNVKQFAVMVGSEFEHPLFVEHLVGRNQLIFVKKSDLVGNCGSAYVLFVCVIAYLGLELLYSLLELVVRVPQKGHL